MMSNIPLEALKKSFEEVNKAIAQSMADSDDKMLEEDFDDLSGEDRKMKLEMVKEERLQRARAISSKRLRRDSFS